MNGGAPGGARRSGGGWLTHVASLFFLPSGAHPKGSENFGGVRNAG